MYIYILFNADLLIFNGFIMELFHSPQKKPISAMVDEGDDTTFIK